MQFNPYKRATGISTRDHSTRPIRSQKTTAHDPFHKAHKLRRFLNTFKGLLKRKRWSRKKKGGKKSDMDFSHKYDSQIIKYLVLNPLLKKFADLCSRSMKERTCFYVGKK